MEVGGGKWIMRWSREDKMRGGNKVEGWVDVDSVDRR